MIRQKIRVIVGPTASGKSALAVQIAKHLNGSVVNADAMQIYQDLCLISARPTPAETQGIPHLLYGYADAYFQSSVQDWLNRVVPILKQTSNPVLVGGTGLYLSSLINGINIIPDVDESIRRRVREMDMDEVRNLVQDCSATDPQRLRRALEVQLTTGRPLSYFTQQPKQKLLDADFKVIFLNPPRPLLYQRCALRFHQMIEQGGLDEVKRLMTLKPTGGVLKAIGVPEIISYLQGDISKEKMCEQAILSTRHYAKRQITWFRHQLKADMILNAVEAFHYQDL